MLPLLFGMSAGEPAAGSHGAAGHDAVMHSLGGGAATNILAVVVHTLGYLVVTGLVAWVVYEKLGLALLRSAWLNLDLIWAVALMVTGGFVLLI